MYVKLRDRVNYPDRRNVKRVFFVRNRRANIERETIFVMHVLARKRNRDIGACCGARQK